MIHINARKRYLNQLIQGEIENHHPLKTCTLVGVPKSELIEKIQGGPYELMKWMEKNKIPFEVKKYESMTIDFYISRLSHQGLTPPCYIKVENPTVEQVNQIIEHGFEELWDVYEVELPNLMIERLLGNAPENVPFTFEDLLYLLKDYRQSEIANLISRSPQAICDFKKGRMTPTLEVMKALMWEFPLLP